MRTENLHLIAFIGPARTAGSVTGHAEKDTIAYRPVFGALTRNGWSFCLDDE